MDNSQVLYLDRWVSRDHFRAFVYNKEGQKLAKSYDEYAQLISSGIWSARPYQEPQFTESELIESNDLEEAEAPSIIEIQLEQKDVDDKNVVEMKTKKGSSCLNQKKV